LSFFKNVWEDFNNWLDERKKRKEALQAIRKEAQAEAFELAKKQAKKELVKKYTKQEVKNMTAEHSFVGGLQGIGKALGGENGLFNTAEHPGMAREWERNDEKPRKSPSKSGKRGKRKAETNEEKGIWDGNFPDQDNIGKMLKN
jgi:hypothetical protein